MHLDSPEALGVLNTLFETVAPSSLRPVDMLLKSMFTTPVTMVRALIVLAFFQNTLNNTGITLFVYYKSELVLSCILPLQASVATVQLWVSGILAILRVLVSQSTEDIVLSRIHELSLSPHLLSCHTIKRLQQQSLSPSDQPACDVQRNQEPNGEAQKSLPEETFARWVEGCLVLENPSDVRIEFFLI